MSSLIDLGNAAWRLRKWVNDSNEERKMPAYSALKTIDRFLKESYVEIIDPVGSKFDVGLAIAVVNNEAENQDEEKLFIIETIKPIITIDGQVAQYGQVVLGDQLCTEKRKRKSDDKTCIIMINKDEGFVDREDNKTDQVEENEKE